MNSILAGQRRVKHVENFSRSAIAIFVGKIRQISSNGASGTPTELATAFLNEFRQQSTNMTWSDKGLGGNPRYSTIRYLQGELRREV